jgi:mono/diheme cytochrome c family protein
MVHALNGLVALAFAAVVVSLAAPGISLSAEDADPEKGRASYMMYCMTCHGEKGDGKGPAGAALNPPPRDFSKAMFSFDTDGDGKPGTDADLAAIIMNGAAKYGGSPLMTPWVHLQQQDIDQLVAYIRSLGVPATVTDADPPSQP